MKEWLVSLGQHKGLKLLSLLLAVAIWLAVGGEERAETTLSFTLEMANVPHELVVTGEVPAAIQVRVMGPQSQVRKLSQTKLTYTLDLAGYKGGRFTFPLGPGSFPLPRDVAVTRIQPNSLTINLAPLLTRTVPIKPVLEGTPPEGSIIKEVKIRPPQITISGPATELADLKGVPTRPIDVSHLKASGEIATDVNLKSLHLTPREHVAIVAEIAVEAREITRTVSGVAVVARPRPAQLAPAQVSLTLQGPYPELKGLKASDLSAWVDTTNLGRGRQRLEVSVGLPEGVRLLRVQPGSVTASPLRSP